MHDKKPLYTAFQKYDVRKNTKTFERVRLLPAEPGLAHALDTFYTHEGDPWRRHGRGPSLVGAKRPHFYDHEGPRAACGRRVKVVAALHFNQEDPDACPECAALVASGEAWGRWAPRGVPTCREYLRIEDAPDGVQVYSCALREYHHGEPHRAVDGATWDGGPETLTPPPDGFVERR